MKRRLGRLLAAVGALLVLTVGAGGYVVSGAPQAQAAGTGPCDIYASGGTPCVAAHSTTRALYGAYNGPLYQVRRSSDNTTRDIGVLSAGGVRQRRRPGLVLRQHDLRHHRSSTTSPAATTASPRRPPATGPAPPPADRTTSPTRRRPPITVGGQKAYGVYIAPGTGYRNNNTNGVATGDQPEGIYAVVDGTHYNQWCCFDYGNAQTDGHADAPAIMETVYFGANKQWGYGRRQPAPGSWPTWSGGCSPA